MVYVFAAAVVLILVIVAGAIWRRRAWEADMALRRVDAYIDSGRIQSRLIDVCNSSR